VDLKTNNYLVDLIRPVQDQYNFGGFSKFVVNASELSNSELFDELYNCAVAAEREGCIQRAKQENMRFLDAS
jgi:hypothetical protein